MRPNHTCNPKGQYQLDNPCVKCTLEYFDRKGYRCYSRIMIGSKWWLLKYDVRKFLQRIGIWRRMY